MQPLTVQQSQTVTGGALPLYYAYFGYVTALATLIDGVSAFGDGFTTTWNERKAADAKKENTK